MNTPADEALSADTGQPTTKYYFAYGSNLHLLQMKKRCPGSKFIGSAKLVDYRWQINERGYANVIEAQGHWVEGLVYEINARDEARLDINEGVSKDAYRKQYMTVMLRRADAALYRRPVSWIVNNGGPDQARHIAYQSIGPSRIIVYKPHLEHNILVYVSPRYIVDSEPKEEYINRINSGIADARALGMTPDYVSNCVRPFVPATSSQNSGPSGTTANSTATKPKVVKKIPAPAKKVKQPTQEAKRTTPPRGREPSPNKTTHQRPIQTPPPPPQSPGAHIQRLPRNSAPGGLDRLIRPPQSRSHAVSAPPLPPRPIYPGVTLQLPAANRRRPLSEVGPPAPPLPPRPRRIRSIPVIVTQEGFGGYWYR
ncbi:aig2 family [Fusarium longipes]|uniref:gamma-glutamylcyclotransferase n=1 Tax=Fusarium longipes TaxID=694270 RepID=A0A395RKC1_9HYPO|nr:aig2 family [Fusarium longipes]